MADTHFETILTQQDAKTATLFIMEEINQTNSKGDAPFKKMINQMFDNMLRNLTSDVSPAHSKLSTLLILRDLTQLNANISKKESKYIKIFSVLLTHQLIKYLENVAQTVDPYKPVHEKGKAYFPESSIVGNQYIRICLQLIKYWAARFPSNKQKKPTSFKKALDRLNDKKVIFPTDYKFFDIEGEGKGGEQSRSKMNNDRSSRDNRESTPMGNTSNGKGPAGIKSEIKFQNDKILNFLEVIEVQQEDQIIKQILKTHANLTKQRAIFDKLGGDVHDLDPQTITQFFNIQEFITKEDEFFKKYIDSSKDFQSYIFNIKGTGQILFGQGNNKKQTKTSSMPPKQPMRIQNTPQNAIGSKMNSQPPPPPAQAVRESGFDPQVLSKVGAYFQKIQQRSKSPITATGFTKINESVSKQKASNVSVSKLARRTVSPANKPKNLGKSTNSLRDSKLAPIFQHPPNLNPPPRKYQGKLIDQRLDIGEVLKSISKSQGLRRFKTANFKGKSSLFQNEHIQIGYKTQSIYEEVQSFRILIKIQLFIGNLSDETIRNLTLQFKGNSNILLYANPKIVDASIGRGSQGKIELIIIPLRPDFPLITMRMKYTINGQAKNELITLPNSVLKLASFLEISKSQFQNRWSQVELYKTNQFPLCHYLPPDTFTKWMPSLTELTPYYIFNTPDGNNDFELFCSIIMMQQYEGLLKIIVRPNLNVVVQLGVEDQNDEAREYFTSFLQSFQQFMKEVAGYQ